jgi:hypothetical protein
MDMDTANILHGTNSQIDTASASTDQQVDIPAANVIPDLASQSKTTAILSKQSYTFESDEARKRKKTRGYIDDVTIYAE